MKIMAMSKPRRTTPPITPPIIGPTAALWDVLGSEDGCAPDRLVPVGVGVTESIELVLEDRTVYMRPSDPTLVDSENLRRQIIHGHINGRV